MCTFTIVVCINLPSLRGINGRSPHHTSPRRGGLKPLPNLPPVGEAFL